MLLPHVLFYDPASAKGINHTSAHQKRKGGKRKRKSGALLMNLLFFVDKEHQERARGWTMRGKELESLELFQHLMPMLNWSCQCR